MKRILIHAGMTPLDTPSAADILLTNPIEDNIGNLLFQNSVFRTFMDEGVAIEPDYYNFDTSEERAKEINDKYDYYLLPLANYFRESYMPFLRKQTELIKQLKIPVVVIGIGLQAPTNSKIEDGFSFDDDVRDFVKAVLKRSSMIGLRGKTTARYLKSLGFQEEKDFTVIGCPSMYTYGKHLHIEQKKITSKSLVYVNSARKRINDTISEYLEHATKAFANHQFIPQDIDELKAVYTGHGDIIYNSNYSNYMTKEIYRSSHVQFPLNVTTWLKSLKEADLTFGARIHGNIAAVLAGTPSVLFPIDARTLELAQYHGLNYIRITKQNKNTPLLELMKGMDFQKPLKKHAHNFDHYIDFLDKNGLDHVYKTDRNRKTTLYDKLVSKIKYPEMVTAVTNHADKERLARFESFYPKQDVALQDDIRSMRKQLSRYEKRLTKANDKLEKTRLSLHNQDVILNRKIVRLALKIAGIIKLDFLR